MRRSIRSLAALGSLLVVFAFDASATPTITGLNATELPRSRRVAILGSGFGSDGDVVIAGLGAWTTTWTESRIVAYVPEAAPLGAASLHVVVQGQQSNEVSLTVTERQPEGRVRWTFEADGENLWWRPAIAPDGTIYLHTNNDTDGIVYALSPDGGLLWTQRVNWHPYVPPSAGPDGALYVGSIGSVYRISPQGQIDWEFYDPGAQGIHSSPTIGPDGRLYGAYDVGLGAFALDPLTGDLEWSNSGDPLIFNRGLGGLEVVFGRPGPGAPLDRLYVNVDGSSSLYAFTLDGDQIFSRGLALIEAREPVIGSDGTIYVPGYLDRWVVALDPTDGSILWEHNSGTSAGIEGIEVDSADTLYFSYGAYLEAFAPQSQSVVWRHYTGHVLGRLTLTPDGSTIVLHGVPTYGQPGFVKAYETATGVELWSLDLPGQPYPGYRVLGTHHPRITADGGTAYLSTFTVADGSPSPDPRSYLYAIQLDGSSTTAIFDDGFESGDASAWSIAVP